jgi:hypothetical protein
MPSKKDDPTRDPEFQKVVQTFLHTKPRPHKPLGKAKKSSRRKAPQKKARGDTEFTWWDSRGVPHTGPGS